MKNISILGSTGSIGTSTLKVVDAMPGDFNIIGLSANRNIDFLIGQTKKYNPKVVAVADKSLYSKLKSSISGNIEILCGEEGLIRVASHPENDLLVSSIVGSAGLIPTYEAIKAGIDIAIANKEILVMAGEVITNLAKEKNVKLLPVNSEHNALFQCLMGQKKEWVRRLILTASGGPFLHTPQTEFDNIELEQALAHPKWSMGKKISIDSATMMNKGFEIIEAHWLFDVPVESIDVIIHPESIIHSIVEFIDGSYLAQMNVPDMTIPIQNILTYPERKNGKLFQKLDFSEISKLHFFEPDLKKFICLKYAYDAAQTGHTMPAVLNGSNEAAVNMFLKGIIKFVDIPYIIERVMEQHNIMEHPNLDQLIEADKWACATAEELIINK